MEDVKGHTQPASCRDGFFGLLFVAHLVLMGYLGMTFGNNAIMHDEDDLTPPDASGDLTLAYQNIVKVSIWCGIFATTLSAIALLVMTVTARRLVQSALIFAIALSFAWGTMGIGLSRQSLVPITGIFALAICVGYAFIVWDRIPFASSNLATAVTGIRANGGSVLIAFFCQGIALLWTIYYSVAVVGVYNALKSGEIVLGSHAITFVCVMLGISYYWTYRVLMNVVQVTAAGVIGSWWFKPKSSCCDESVFISFFNAIFLSFGSICFGSLVIGPIRFVRQVAAFMRPTRDESTAFMCFHECVYCIQDCLTRGVDNMYDYFNPWAYTYVGLYSYGLLDAGHNATILFRKRGWSMIVSDDLISNVVMMVSVMIGGLTGCFGLLIQANFGFGFTSFHAPATTAFLIGLSVGLVLSSILLGIINGAVNAVIVCFAGSPVEFDQQHPLLSQEMRSAWREVWPGCMDVVDMKVALGV